MLIVKLTSVIKLKENIMKLDTDTITALATPPGRGGVGIIRISGSKAKAIGKKITGYNLEPRYAQFGTFFEVDTNNIKKPIDNGISLHSFTPRRG